MRRLLVFSLVGFAAQLVDGSLGMAYGVTASSLLAALGTSAALTSASVHLAEVGTSLVSGGAHWRAGNISWRTVSVTTCSSHFVRRTREAARRGAGGAVIAGRRR